MLVSLVINNLLNWNVTQRKATLIEMTQKMLLSLVIKLPDQNYNVNYKKCVEQYC